MKIITHLEKNARLRGFKLTIEIPNYSLVSLSAQAATAKTAGTEVHPTGVSFLMVLEAGSLRSKCHQGCFLSDHLLIVSSHSLSSIHMSRKKQRSLVIFLFSQGHQSYRIRAPP